MINMGSAVGYLLLDTTGFKEGINKAIGQLKVFKDEEATTSDKLTGLGKAFTGAGKVLTKNLTMPLVGLGTAAINTTATFDSSMSKVQAISGAVGDDFDRLREKAKEMGAKTKFSASEAADAFTYMAMAGWKTEDMLEGIEGIMSLAAASGEDLASTSDIVTDALTAFGLQAKDSAHFADVLAAASNSANTNVSMLGESFKYVAPVAGALGYTAEDTSIALGLMANSGIKASQAGTALRTMLTNLANPTDDMALAMETLNISLTDSKGNMKSLREIMEDLRRGFSTLSEAESAQVAATLAGKEGMSGLLAIVNSGEADFNKLAKAIDNADGTAENMANTTLDNLSGQWTILKSSLEGAAIAFGDLLMPLIRDLVGLLQKAVDWVNNLTEEQKETIVRIAEVVAVVGPILLILGKVVNTIISVINIVNKVKTVILALKPAIAALNAVLAANPIGIIISAIAALVAAFIYLWNNCESFRQFWIDLWEGIKKVFKDVIDWIVNAFNDVVDFFKSIPEKLGEFFSSIGEWISNAFNEVITFFSELPGKIWDWLTETWESISEWFSELPENIAYWLGYLIGTIVTWATETREKITNWFTELFTSIGEWISTAFNDVVTFLSELPGKLWDWLTGIAEDIRDWGVETFNNIVDWFTTTWENITTFLSELPGKVWEWLKETFNRVVEWGSNIWTKAKEIVSTFINRIVDGLKSLPGKFKEWFTSAINYLKTLPRRMLQIGKDIFNGLWDGLKSIWNKLTGWIDGIVGKIKSIFGKAKEGYNDATSSTNSTSGSYASGLDYVPRDMNVRVHQGEAILTKEENANRVSPGSVFGNVTINIDGAKYSNEESLARAVAEELQILTERKGRVWK